MIKKFLFFLLFVVQIFFTYNNSIAANDIYITKHGYLTSTDNELLKKAIEYTQHEDEEALRKLLNTNLVFMLKEGLKVYIIDMKFFNGMVRIRPVGETVELWTLIEAVKPYEGNVKKPAPKVTKDVSFKVIVNADIPGVKRSLDVFLDKKIYEEELRDTAKKLKEEKEQYYEITSIGYYLPGMKIGAGYWASTNFNPTLNVIIYGLTIEEEEMLLSENLPENVEVIGRWIDNSFTANRTTIYRKGRKIFIEHTFGGNSVSLTNELVEIKSALGRRFEQVKDPKKTPWSTNGDYWIIDSDGKLQIHDNKGLIYTAEKIK